MLSIASSEATPRRHCNGVSRRSFVQIGALGMGGLALPQILAAEEASKKRSFKSVIMIYMCGGPPHQDMYDLKMDAPAEVRGEFAPIATNVPGIEVCELMPNLAKIMDKCVPVRTIIGANGEHWGYQCFTGHEQRQEPAGGWPHFGSAVSRAQGPTAEGIPPFVSLCYTTQHKPYNEPTAGFLGLGHSSFRPMGEGRTDLVLQGITSDRLDNRRNLLTSVDHFRRQWDQKGSMQGMDVFTQRAMGILTSSELFDALDISKEPKEIRDRYGYDNPDRAQGDGAPRVPQNFLLARRLVEAGARVVTVNYSFWDFHGQNFQNCRKELPIFDKGLAALISDLHERGLDKDVAVVAWGEFGRTPTINKDAGRDHWPRVSNALIAGGGMKMGQVIGATDRLGGEAISRPVTFEEVHATLYHHLGIGPSGVERIFDFRGRPQSLITPGVMPIRELV
jgi:hypothetical protein